MSGLERNKSTVLHALPATWAELAKLLSSSSLGRALKALQAEGVITRDGNTYRRSLISDVPHALPTSYTRALSRAAQLDPTRAYAVTLTLTLPDDDPTASSLFLIAEPHSLATKLLASAKCYPTATTITIRHHKPTPQRLDPDGYPEDWQGFPLLTPAQPPSLGFYRLRSRGVWFLLEVTESTALLGDTSGNETTFPDVPSLLALHPPDPP